MIYYDQSKTNLDQINQRKHRLNIKRSIYNKVIKFSTRSPLYMFELSEENRAYALSLKKSTIKLNSILNQYNRDNKDSVFQYKKASSSNDKIAHVDIIGSNYEELPEEFTLKVNSLALSQINSGNEVSTYNSSLPIGIYSFTIDIEDNTYEFQFNITEKCTNKENLLKLIKFINRSKLGVIASFVENHKKETVQSVLKAEFTGSNRQLAFTIKDIPADINSRGIVEYFGLDNVLQYPKNSKFEINGIEKESISNCFTYNKIIKISLHQTSSEEIQITYTPDTDKILESFSIIINTYNNLIDLISNQGDTQKTSAILKNELHHIFTDYINELESCGLALDDTGSIILDDSLSYSAAKDGAIEELLLNEDGYIAKLKYKLNQIMLDPMIYLDKKVVTYPNIAKPIYYNPYIISLYSGMIYNYYC
ncbi:hypothetical protein EDD66_101421 [Mobilisporobacter senegalensis]|uniref:Flagellar hook-associated protein 2 C-terminal domain-containing protein n=1 Tax=Mobilisporobacter senegalensis TaxID=1329262 RepID=A0A3N1Y2N0_9FIRM|nr:hypothetical protein [Mobilisporobacter senegalensis]ROR31802.1 hypothetical protein EDD66_101421 [Mobilisporobacter senegalensis]